MRTLASLFLGLCFLVGIAAPSILSAQELRVVDAVSLRARNFEGLDPDRAYILLGSQYARVAFAQLSRSDTDDLAQVTRIIVTNIRRPFSKQGRERLMLLEVDPADYAIYGAVFPVEGENWGGLCVCMGTVSFTAEAGRIAVLGTTKTILDQMLAGEFPRGTTWPEAVFVRPQIEISLGFGDEVQQPDQIEDDLFNRPRFRLVERMPNYLGLLVDRLEPITGAFDYEGDQMIDLREIDAPK